MLVKLWAVLEVREPFTLTSTFVVTKAGGLMEKLMDVNAIEPLPLKI